MQTVVAVACRNSSLLGRFLRYFIQLAAVDGIGRSCADLPCRYILYELHDVDALGAEGRAYRRGRIGSAGGDLQLYKSSDFLVSHL